MNLLFLGPVCPPVRIEYIKQVSRYFDYPANVLELALIDGFKTYCNVTVISTLKMITKKFYLPLMKFKNQGKGSFDGVILSHFNITYTMIIIGISFTVVTYLVFCYMKPRVGLKPDQYKVEDIKLKI